MNPLKGLEGIIFESSDILSAPPSLFLDERLNEREFKEKYPPIFKEYFGYDLITCEETYVFRDINNKRFIYCAGDYGIFCFPECNTSRRIVAEIDLMFIPKPETEQPIIIVEHKEGAKKLYDKIGRQLLRYILLVSNITGRSVIGYIYLGGIGETIKMAASVNKGNDYYIIFFDDSPIRYSKIIKMEKEDIQNILSYNRKKAEFTIKGYLDSS